MPTPPSIYVLRRSADPLPSRDSVAPGDVVILASGDVLVYTGSMWDLLPGRYVTVEELKEFVTYVASGWPEDPETARADMEGKMPAQFLSRMVQTVERIQKEKGA